MATLAQKGVRPLKTRSGGPPEIRYYPEDASQAFKKGEAVYLDASTLELAEFTHALDDDSQRLLGFAAEDASGTTGTMIAVWIANSDTIFIASVYHSTATSAVLAVTDYGALWPLSMDTTNSNVYPNKENPANDLDMCRIVGLHSDISEDETIGDVYAQCHFIIEAAGRLLDR